MYLFIYHITIDITIPIPTNNQAYHLQFVGCVSGNSWPCPEGPGMPSSPREEPISRKIGK